jgi:uncharacterized membrane protein YeaQ/YmgE (transglycosylase-associated protein family)
MLEIIILWALTRRIGGIVEEKGRKSGWYKLLTVVLWFGGEFAGAIFGALVTGVDESGQCTVYIFALLGAAVGAGIAYAIANSLSPVHTSVAPILSGSADARELLADLRSEGSSETVRALAARKLGQLSTSNLRIVNALIAAMESDPAPAVRKEAARSLNVPMHRAILQQYPELMNKVQEMQDDFH